MMMMSLYAFSQTDTESTSTRQLPVRVLREIAIDLLEGDMAKEKLKITELQLSQARSTITTQTQIISLLRQNETYYTQMVERGEKNFTILNDYTKKLELENKRLKVNGKFKTILLSGVIAGLTYMVIK
jgi:hypothetical protein